MSYVPCSACARHVREDQACPFCGDNSQRAPAARPLGSITSRAAYLLGSVALTAGCQSTPPAEPPVTVAPAYGGPVMMMDAQAEPPPAPPPTAPPATATADAGAKTKTAPSPPPPMTNAPAPAYGAPPPMKK